MFLVNDQFAKASYLQVHVWIKYLLDATDRELNGFTPTLSSAKVDAWKSKEIQENKKTERIEEYFSVWDQQELN